MDKNTPLALRHRAECHRYEMDLGEGVACIDYTLTDGCLDLIRTFVPESHAGQGIASALTEAVVRDIAARGLKLRPRCSYIVRWMERHPEWQSLVGE